jgi:CubicO group peptidase (beta-lactamase class C family)
MEIMMKSLPRRMYRAFCLIAVLTPLIFLHSYAMASVARYPSKEWAISTPEQQGMQSSMLADMMQHIVDYGFEIHSVLIVRNGKLVLDSYFWPFSAEMKHILHSCTKSITSALIGIAIDKGYIQSVNQPIKDFFPKLATGWDDLKKSITIEDLLMMASGLDCKDSYIYGWAGLHAMFASQDWAQYVLDLPMVASPGSKFEYCNGLSYLLSAIIQNATKMKALDFAAKYLFEPIGIRDVSWATNPQGVNMGYGEMQLKPHDMARFGWLYLNKGRWGDRQIVPSSWVEVSTRRHIDATLFDSYGYQWWVDSAGYFVALGYKGQRIFVIPKKDMVVVFTGNLTGPETLIPKKLLDSYIITASRSQKALPQNTNANNRLDALVKSVAQEPAETAAEITWVSEAEGVAKDGLFSRTALPAFEFEYPRGSKKLDIDRPGQVMRMKTLDDIDFSTSIIGIPAGITLETFGPRIYAENLEKVGSQIQIISNKKITLKGGTDAYRTEITWLWKNSILIKTILVTAYRNGKAVFLCAHSWKGTCTIEPIFESLNFK